MTSTDKKTGIAAIAAGVQEVEALRQTALKPAGFSGRVARHWCGTNNAVEASRNLAEVLALAGEDRLRYAFSIRIDDRDWSIAHAVGQSRTLIALANGQTNCGVRRGAADARVDAEGAIAEWAIAKAVGLASELERMSALVSHKADKDVDAVAAGKRLDIKSVGQSRTKCYINRAQHVSKKPDAYLVAHISRADNIDVYVISAEAVGKWPVYSAGYSPCFNYSMPGFLTALPPLDSADAA